MDKISVCFGHREIFDEESLIVKLKHIYQTLINDGYNIFYFGGYGKFDELCNKIVKEYQKIYKTIKRVYVRPYYENLDNSIVELYKKEFDDCIYLKPKNNFKRLAILYRNYEMIEKSDFIVFYANGNGIGGANKLLEYANTKNKKYINICQ